MKILMRRQPYVIQITIHLSFILPPLNALEVKNLSGKIIHKKRYLASPPQVFPPISLFRRAVKCMRALRYPPFIPIRNLGLALGLSAFPLLPSIHAPCKYIYKAALYFLHHV